METIIQQILSEVVAEILEKLENFVTVGINETVSSLEAASSKMILNIIKAAVGSIDEELVEGTKALRKQDHITVKERRVPRIIQTRFGDLEYERTYFRLGDGSYVYLTDQVIGVTPYSRISEEVIASILQRTSTQSYQDAIDSTKANTTRQTVHNRLVALDELTAEARRAEKTPEELHLFADEDHVHLNPKGCAIVPLVSITEGIDTSNPKRHKTINPFHIAGYGMGTDAFKENVAAVMAERYDLDKVKHIFIHADGGKWIESLTGILPNAEIIMDGFHLEKHLKRYLRLTGASCYAGQIRRALREGDIESFRKYSSKIYSRQTSEDDRDKADDFVTYALGHWNAIVLRMNGRICGSCTEPLVSHTLSQRLSRDPIA